MTQIEDERLVRMTTALSKKCPKLAKCRESGARSVLALEDSDIALSNYVLVSAALEEVAKAPMDMPDEVWLVTTILQKWEVRRLYADGMFAPTDDYRDFDKDTLVDVTNSAAK